MIVIWAVAVTVRGGAQEGCEPPLLEPEPEPLPGRSEDGELSGPLPDPEPEPLPPDPGMSEDGELSGPLGWGLTPPVEMGYGGAVPVPVPVP